MCIGNNFSNMFCSLMIYLIINRCILKVFLKKLLIFIPIYESILIYATKKSLIYNQGLKRADDGNRTRDLRLTKATLYRLSHSSNMNGQMYLTSPEFLSYQIIITLSRNNFKILDIYYFLILRRIL